MELISLMVLLKPPPHKATHEEQRLAELLLLPKHREAAPISPV